jgi:glycosyltransferase involved in cell wall biosynthesis
VKGVLAGVDRGAKERTRQGTTTPEGTPDFPTLAEPRTWSDALGGGLHAGHAGLAGRINTLLDALGPSHRGHETDALPSILEHALADCGPRQAWLALAVLTGRLPDSATVMRTVRAIRLDGPLPALWSAIVDCGQSRQSDWPAIEVITGRVVVDVHHTSRALFATGIQRVARETIRRWRRDHQPLFIGWSKDYEALRRLSDEEIEAALNGRAKNSQTDIDRDPPTLLESRVVVPWDCTLVVPELPAEPARASRYQAVMRYSGSTAGLIGFDCVPLTAAETSAEGMSGGFALYLAVAARVDRISAISETAATEYRGWRTMLGGTGQVGPDIRAISLPVEAPDPSESARQRARELLGVGPLPIVLAVGSHEPRKNHLALLQAAEVLWREGIKFTLAFVGGNSWHSEPFVARVEAMQNARRPLQTIMGLPDDMLWAAYRIAYCTVFPSLHEGFGLPVAESLASGTPVITSNFGSMREIAQHGGALLVDPRNDQDLADALRRLLLEEGLRDRLVKEASKLPVRTWNEYAAETWAYLVEGAPAAATADGWAQRADHPPR